jgi:hypothetical protein
MYRSALLALALTPTVSGSLGAAQLPADKVASRAAVSHDEARRTLSIQHGPMDIPAGLGYTGEVVTFTVEAPIPVDGWLRSFEIELTDARGEPIQESLLHHAGLFAPDRRDLFTPAMERIVAFGQETEAIRLPGQLGYRVRPGDSLLLLGALYNSSSIPYDSLYLSVNMSYATSRREVRHRASNRLPPLRRDVRPRDVLPLYLDVMPPGKRIYDVPPGRSRRSMEWSPAVNGRILGLGGHLHQYGEAVVLEDVTTGDTLWVGRATHDADHQLLGISRNVYLFGKRMSADHLYRITAIYNNPTSHVIPGAMGKIGGVFLPDPGAVLPPSDRSHPDYVRDWEAMVTHGHEAGHVHAAEQTVAGPAPGKIPSP